MLLASRLGGNAPVCGNHDSRPREHTVHKIPKIECPGLQTHIWPLNISFVLSGGQADIQPRCLQGWGREGPAPSPHLRWLLREMGRQQRQEGRAGKCSWRQDCKALVFSLPSAENILSPTTEWGLHYQAENPPPSLLGFLGVGLAAALGLVGLPWLASKMPGAVRGWCQQSDPLRVLCG